MLNLVALKWSVALSSIRQILQAKGRMPFSEFMQIALYQPKLGYYMQAESPIKRDFTTAPELSSAVGFACAVAWQQLTQGLKQPILCELGPGSGRLTLAILECLINWEMVPEQIWLIELNEARIIEQKATLANLPKAVLAKCQWHSKIPNQPWSGMLLGNEVLDAQPFDIIKFQGQWSELWVDGESLDFCAQKLRPELQALIPKGNFPDGYQTEVFPGMAAFLKAHSANMISGGMLFLDYGYQHSEFYHAQRLTGSSASFYDNKLTFALLENPGARDLTSHVDFSFVAKKLLENELEIAGYLTKAQFLMQTNAHEHLLNLSGISYHKACLAFKALLYEMGDIFKVLLATKNNENWNEWLDGYGVDRLDL